MILWPILDIPLLNWNSIKLTVSEISVAFSSQTLEAKVRINLFIKILYAFLLLKIILLLPVFFEIHQAFWVNEQITNPSLKQLIFNFFQCQLWGQRLYPQLIISIFIIATGLIFKPNYIVAILVFLVFFNFYRILTLINDGSDIVLIVLLFLAVFLSSKPRFNSRIPSIYQNAVINGAVILIKVQITLIYFYSGLDKLSSHLWRNGEAMFQILNLEYFILPSLRERLFQAPDLLFIVLAWCVILFEVLFPVLVWFPKTKNWVLMAGVVMHLFIAIVMSLPDFGLVMIVTYLLFLNDSDIKNIKDPISTLSWIFKSAHKTVRSLLE